MNILNQKEITFKDLERFFFEMGCKIAKGFLQEFLEQTDKQLAENRNKKELRHGGKKITTLKTLMGEVTVKSENVKIKVHIFYNVKVHNYYISFFQLNQVSLTYQFYL